MYDVVALGELLIDFAPVSKDEAGYPTLAANPGGAPSNYLAALAKYGAKTALLGKVGTDAFGKMLIQTLKDTGIETKGIIEDDSVFTTLSFVTLNESGDRSFSFARKPGADTCISFDELDLSLIDNTKAFHIGTLSLTDEPAKEATQKAIKYAKDAGKMITFDPNLRQSLWDDLDNAKKQILWGLGQSDIVKISDEEVEFLWGCDEKIGAKKLLCEFGIKLAMVTCGPKGALLQNKNASVFISCPEVEPIDTTGAGDIFGGSAVSRILKRGKPPEELIYEELSDIAKFAVTAASLSTQISGAIPSIPDESEISAITLLNKL
ncbi:MAG: carbohydrate kinase [Oscillospiraceae bacterium]|jgi:sugar/nucleoside kinase (ribokinase family)|nr:carbohydrate kinase [Oscillospiraceae bacterium]